MKSGVWLVLVPPLLGLLVGVYGYGDQIVDLLFPIFKCALALLVSGVIFVMITFFSGKDNIQEEPRPLYPNDPWKKLTEAQIRRLSRTAFRLDARGHAFIVMQSRSGKLAAREINPQTGRYIDVPVVASERSFTPGADLAALLLYRINSRGKRYGHTTQMDE